MKRVVFDLDDTISVHRNRDYANATPVAPVIEQMRRLRADLPEVQIVILTARGMASCNGDAKLAEERNRPVLEDWLKRNGVPYDEIIFGKPLGDAYVDDKAVSATEFASWGCARLSGGYSGKPVTRVGTIVVKRCDNAQEVADWYALAHSYCFRDVSFPTLISHQLGKLYLRYEVGIPLSGLSVETLVRGKYLQKVKRAVDDFGECRMETDNDVPAYVAYVADRCRSVGIDPKPYCEPVERLAERLRVRTFHHGDFSTMNIIRRTDGSIVAIDPNPKGDVQNHLVDAAKFYASLCGLEAVLSGKPVETGRADAGRAFLALFAPEEQFAVVALARTLVIRVAYYSHKRGEGHIVSRLLEDVRL